jgi:hypothetical protein
MGKKGKEDQRAANRKYDERICNVVTSVADPGCLSRIPVPNFFHPGYRIQIFSIPDPHQRI